MEKIIELKLSQLKQYDSVHHWLAAELELPDYYGHNLDALWDCLTTDVKLPVTILWNNDCQDNNDYSAITNLFEEAAGEVEGLSFGYLLEDEA